MSGPSFWEFLLICMIGLVVLGPKRLPEVAQQVGTWIGHARRMARTLRRQLEEELELDKTMNVRPSPRPSAGRSTSPAIGHAPAHDDVTYSPLHPRTAIATGTTGDEVAGGPAIAQAADENPAPATGDSAVSSAESEQRKHA